MGKWDFAMKSWPRKIAPFDYGNMKGLFKENERISEMLCHLSIKLRNHCVLYLKKRASEEARLEIERIARPVITGFQL